MSTEEQCNLELKRFTVVNQKLICIWDITWLVHECSVWDIRQFCPESVSRIVEWGLANNHTICGPIHWCTCVEEN